MSLAATYMLPMEQSTGATRATMSTGMINARVPPWCGAVVDASISNLKQAIRTDSAHFKRYRSDLFYGRPSFNDFNIVGLFSVNKCGNITIPVLPATKHKNDRQHIANRFWRVQLLNVMFKKIFKLIKIHQSVNTLDKDISKLSKLHFMLQHFVDNVEEYLMAEKCSCENEECIVHEMTTSAIEKVVDQVRMELHPPSCTRMNLLGEVIKKISEDVHFVDRILKGQSVRITTWKLCKLTVDLANSMC